MPAQPRRFRLLALLVAALAGSAELAAQIHEEDLDPDPEPVAVEAAPAGELPLAAAGARALADGDLAGAAALYRRAAAAEPAAGPRAALTVRAAWALHLLGDAAGARAELERALYDDPHAPLLDGRVDPAFLALRQDAERDAMARREREGVARVQRAAAAIAERRHDEARALLDEALRLAPDDPEALYDLALVDLRTGRQDAALAGFERVLALDLGGGRIVPDGIKTRALNNAAVIYLAREQPADAATALDEATRLAPRDAAAWFNLGLAREKLGERDAALAALRRARELAPDDVATSRQLGVSLLRAGEFGEAAERLGSAVALEPESADLNRLLGQARRGAGDLAGAAAALERALVLDPGGRHGEAGLAARLLAEVRLEQGDAAGAAAAAAEATALDPEGADGWALLGLARLRAGDAAAALEPLERASALAPGRADVAHNLGTARLALGRLDEAAAAYRAALTLDPALAESAATLAAIEERQRAAAAAAADPRNRPAGGAPAVEARLGAALEGALVAGSGQRGLRVASLAPRGAAARAGLVVGDLLLTVEGRPIGSPEGLLRLLEPGRPLRLGVQRGAERLTLLLALGG